MGAYSRDWDTSEEKVLLQKSGHKKQGEELFPKSDSAAKPTQGDCHKQQAKSPGTRLVPAPKARPNRGTGSSSFSSEKTSHVLGKAAQLTWWGTTQMGREESGTAWLS